MFCHTIFLVQCRHIISPSRKKKTFIILSFGCLYGLLDYCRLYFAKLGLGSPPKDYYVQVDTRSDILWVNCVDCKSCPKKSGLGVCASNFSFKFNFSVSQLEPLSWYTVISCFPNYVLTIDWRNIIITIIPITVRLDTIWSKEFLNFKFGCLWSSILHFHIQWSTYWL